MDGYIENDSIGIDFSNASYLRAFINAHADDDYPIIGLNEAGEHVEVSALSDNVDVMTFQKNGHTRHVTYWVDGTVEEWYEY